ncbi:WW domain-containing oxidoreductase isoform X1 [Homalodisca vitripennis]|uniref:WW domain-containing oxidoreductase isoform X1 n=1 Tax=Homalodisca vitripennis TaxID=197043 RepID=UPI001EEBA36B|nr:WW domain-containing oxidoreductase isoform X1 [Homalodisca vitripennis]XP_046672027.1 WW domain-containing oxidoreductase isoform X1 [Homalodisca vitripennis]XP_046672028.1 WW domain-containing oxidoreductase isoform X1 [Homalodisca vitripennis]
MASVLPDSDSEDDLPPGWEERATVDGSVYYVNHNTKGTQWTHPRTGKKKRVAGELPFGWEKVVEDSGKVLYVDHENHRTTYTDPRLAFAQEEKESPLMFRQRFDGSSTALQVLHGRDLGGKVAVVTGANCGIGYETARALARHGCHVVLACRSLTRAQEAIERIQAERPQAICTSQRLDLKSLKSVKEFANSLKGHPAFNRGIDMLILNAGVFALPHSLTEDGLETTFQVNHLSQFYLTLLLEDLLARASSSRVVFVSSESHRFSTLNVDNMSEEWFCPKPQNYWSMMAYNDSKLCNVLVANELARRWASRDILVFSCHPGNMVSSNISRHWCPYRLLFILVRPFTKSLEQAASTQVYCATAPELSDVSGLYFNNCCRCEPSKQAQNTQLSSRLWQLSLDFISSRFSSLDIPDKYRNKP